MNRRVVVTGMGILSAAGDSTDDFHDNLCAGKECYQPMPELDLQALSHLRCTGIPAFSPMDYLGDCNFRPLDRAGRFAVTAASLALNDAGWSSEHVQEKEMGLFLGTVFCGLQTIMEFDRKTITKGPKYVRPMDFANTVINAAAGQTAVWHNLRGINSTIAAGSASGLTAIIQAGEAIRLGQAEVLLAGGSEALCFESLYTYFQTGLLAMGEQAPVPFDSRGQGFAHGEGAALLVLEERELALARGARILAELTGFAGGFDPSRGSDKQLGVKAMSRTMKQALTSANLEPNAVDAVCASANGLAAQDQAEAQALQNIFHDHIPPIVAPKAVLGECLGAGGAFQAAAMISSLQKQSLPGVAHCDASFSSLPNGCLKRQTQAFNGTVGMVDAFGYDGNCNVLIMKHQRGIA